MTGVPRFHTLQIGGSVQGHIVGVLIDGGTSHKFIDAAWVKKRDIQTEYFDGFSVQQQVTPWSVVGGFLN